LSDSKRATISVPCRAGGATSRLRVFKGDGAGVRPGRSISVQAHSRAASATSYIWWLRGFSLPLHPRRLEFFSTDLPSSLVAASQAVSAVLRLGTCRASPGTAFSGRSLRSGGITAAYAHGLPLARIMAISGHRVASTVHLHYLDALVPPSSSAARFFDRFLF
jgi:hypothetical protein